MPTRNTARESQAPESDTAAGATAVADMTRQQMASTASTTSAMLRAFDTLQQAQQHMIQRAALLQEQTAERLRNATTPAEVMSIQSTMLVSGMTEFAQYTQELMLASLKAQSEFMRPTETGQQGASAVPPSATPLFQAWQAVFSGPLNGAAARPH
ncbi:phasin family protein [Ramlibacter sp. AN1015]|uniref:phasin family protein n=1 Tax=Ramlibacter sp. AN1015 TaxID=3133428 RepID=UPI0030BD5F42